MRAKEYLKQIRMLDIKIKSRTRELRELRARTEGLKGISYDKPVVQGGGTGDHMAADVAGWVDLEREIKRMTDLLVRKKHKIINQIEQLEDPRHVEILTLRYVDCLSFEKIAVEMKYTQRQVHNIHGSALQEFERFHCFSV